MEDEELKDNEELLEGTEEVQENLEEEVLDTSEEEEKVQDTVTEDDIERKIEERANEMFEQKVGERLKRDRISRERKQNKELAKYKQLENIIKAGTGVDSLDEVISKTSSYYQSQGINIPEFNNSRTDEEEEWLGEKEAKSIIDLGEEEMNSEANRIHSIPPERRTIREKTIFNTICKELLNIKEHRELKSKGLKEDLLDTKEFNDFRNQFNVNVPILTIYEMYNKVNGKEVERPKSPGSAKSTSTIKQIKDYYSPEDFDKLTDEELNDPKIMEVVDKSRLQWFK